ncbi:MAG: rhomboid family intramembrane serine protease [Cytophagales bacterium]|nr:rhomboid family intramembrane serine protease [Cytophagales bacterium]
MIPLDSTGTLLIIIANIIFSYQGFQNLVFLDQYLFRVKDILSNKQYVRLISSGFLHGDYIHLLFNMVSFYSFGGILERVHGTFFMCVIYGVSLIGGNLLSLIMHRREPYYSALGASGAVSGIIFAVILLFPGMEVNMFFIPIDIPGWIYAILYTIYSIYGMRSQSDNIGHDAHMGGAIVGILATIAWYPVIVFENWMVVVGVLLPTVLYLVFYKKIDNLKF